MRLASLVRLVIVDVWVQCRKCHVIHFAETGFPRVPTKLRNLTVSPNTAKRETVSQTSLNTCAGRVLHSAGSVKVLYIKRCGLCDLCNMLVGGTTLTVSAPTAHSVTVTSALTYVLLPTGARGIFAHPVQCDKYVEVLSFLVRDAAYVGSCLPTFRGSMLLPSSRFKQSSKIAWQQLNPYCTGEGVGCGDWFSGK
jgi:hypothetical protein